jgi:tRNA-2-methylthio-N6-dimethylallyladenosine synthase
MAEDRAYGQIHNIRKQESVNSDQKRKIIILTGCLANRKDVQKRLKDKVDLFWEIKDFEGKFKNFVIENYLEIGNWKLKIAAQQSDKDCLNYLSINPKYNSSHSAFVPIMTGCNNFCSYCVVPYARGREVSRPTDEIIAEIENLLKNGCKEITLLGQNVNSYQFINKNSSADEADESKIITFPKLLQKIEKIPGHFWIRFISSHPKDFSDELIETVAKSKKVCEHIHLPIQAGSDKILTAMNRKYTAKHYLGLIKKIRSAFGKYKPDAPYAISSDIIVGFPGETKKDFLESARIMEKVKYDLVYFGQFSPRPDTVAWEMKDNVLKAEKSRREKFLNEILKKTAFSNNQKYLGETLEVLVDHKKNGFYFGRTRSGKDIKIHLTLPPSLLRRENKKENLIGTFVKVKIIKANIWNLEASPN